MSKKKKDDIVKAVQEAPTKAVRVIPNSEQLVQQSYGFVHKLLVQLEVKLNSGAELTKDDVAMYRMVQQSLVDLRDDERKAFRLEKDRSFTEDEIIALLQDKGVRIS